jgi:starch phosphorylase
MWWRIVRLPIVSRDNLDENSGNAQLNDTHPAVAVVDLMCRLVDDYGLHWDTAWDVTQTTMGYTDDKRR